MAKRHATMLKAGTAGLLLMLATACGDWEVNTTNGPVATALNEQDIDMSTVALPDEGAIPDEAGQTGDSAPGEAEQESSPLREEAWEEGRQEGSQGAADTDLEGQAP